MSTIVFFCIPAYGHTNPTLGVVRELAARGHKVVYYSYDTMRKPIEAAGAAFVSCNAYDAEQRLSPKDGERLGRDLAFSTQVLVDTTLALDNAILSDMRALAPIASSRILWRSGANSSPKSWTFRSCPPQRRSPSTAIPRKS